MCLWALVGETCAECQLNAMRCTVWMSLTLGRSCLGWSWSLHSTRWMQMIWISCSWIRNKYLKFGKDMSIKKMLSGVGLCGVHHWETTRMTDRWMPLRTLISFCFMWPHCTFSSSWSAFLCMASLFSLWTWQIFWKEICRSWSCLGCLGVLIVCLQNFWR